MQLQKYSAQQIVDEIGELVHQNINMMDNTGRIIASTDVNRIGQIHEGARRIIEEQLQELYISAEEETITAKCGLNLPIKWKNDVIGVIGITGDYEKVISLGQVVRKMTEILVLERDRIEQEKLDARVKNRFLEEWIMGEGLSNSEQLAERGLTMGIDISVPRRIMIVSIASFEKYSDTLEGQQRLEEVEHMIARELKSYKDCIVLRNTGRQIILLPAKRGMPMEELTSQLAEAAQTKYQVRLLIGYDGKPEDIHTAYLEASKAWRGSVHTKSGILCYLDMRTELFLDDISVKHKKEYLQNVFPGCDAVQLRNWITLLDSYFAAEGSLSHAADILFVHKNTLQYRIHKLIEITGLDVRLPSESAKLFLALLFYRDLENDMAHPQI